MNRLAIVTLLALGAMASQAPAWAQSGTPPAASPGTGIGTGTQGDQARRHSGASGDAGSTQPGAPARAGVVKSKSNITNN